METNQILNDYYQKPKSSYAKEVNYLPYQKVQPSGYDKYGSFQQSYPDYRNSYQSYNSNSQPSYKSYYQDNNPQPSQSYSSSYSNYGPREAIHEGYYSNVDNYQQRYGKQASDKYNSGKYYSNYNNDRNNYDISNTDSRYDTSNYDNHNLYNSNNNRDDYDTSQSSSNNRDHYDTRQTSNDRDSKNKKSNDKDDYYDADKKEDAKDYPEEYENYNDNRNHNYRNKENTRDQNQQRQGNQNNQGRGNNDYNDYQDYNQQQQQQPENQQQNNGNNNNNQNGNSNGQHNGQGREPPKFDNFPNEFLPGHLMGPRFGGDAFFGPKVGVPQFDVGRQVPELEEIDVKDENMKGSKKETYEGVMRNTPLLEESHPTLVTEVVSAMMSEDEKKTSQPDKTNQKKKIKQTVHTVHNPANNYTLLKLYRFKRDLEVAGVKDPSATTSDATSSSSESKLSKKEKSRKPPSFLRIYSRFFTTTASPKFPKQEKETGNVNNSSDEGTLRFEQEDDLQSISKNDKMLDNVSLC